MHTPTLSPIPGAAQIGKDLQVTEYDHIFLEIPPGWKNARCRLVSELLDRFTAKSGKLLDIGCGSGFKWPYFDTCGLDIDPLALDAAVQNGIHAISGNANHLPFEADSEDVVLLLDTIEHIDEPQIALREAYRVLKPKGIIIASVPLYPGLWSKHDVINGHKKRYVPGELAELLKSSGFRPVYTTKWNVLGLVGALVRKYVSYSDQSLLVNLFAGILKAEAILAAHCQLPLGLSEFVVGVAVKGAKEMGVQNLA